MQNLLEETLEELRDNNKGEKDVCFVTDGEKFFTWNSFVKLAKDINYDDGFGREEINASLKIVGKDWWLERHEYDGSEWREFKTIPIRTTEFSSLKKENLLEE